MSVEYRTLKNRTGTTVQWAASTRILLSGELGYDSDLNILRIGNGVDLWPNLQDVVQTDEVTAMINTALAGITIGEDGNPQALTDHINSVTPHPIYDDGPSLALLYQNAKV